MVWLPKGTVVLTAEPPRPPHAPASKRLNKWATALVRHAELSMIIQTNIVTPMIRPPDRDARVPARDIAPLVPGGTLANVVTSRGGDLDRIPSSEAIVSPKQHAK